MAKQYNKLLKMYKDSCKVCDPIESIYRKSKLLDFIAMYLIYTDNPKKKYDKNEEEYEVIDENGDNVWK